MGVVGEMTGDDEGLKVTSVMAHDGGHSLDHASLQDEVRYVTVDESGQAVTIMYPHVNFVEFPGVHGELSLDQGALGGDAGMVLQQDFSGDGPITVVTSDDTGEQLALLDQGHEHSAVAMGGSEGTQAITYLTATDDGPDGSPSAILGEQLIQIPASDQSGSTHTITVPLSFLNDGSGVSILQGLSHLQLPFVGEAGGDSITLSSPMDTDHIASVGSADVTQSQVLSELQSSAVTPTTTQPSVHGQAHGLPTPSHLGIQTSSSKVPLTSSAKPVVVKTNSQSSNKHGSHQPRKLIGSGPTAISAQGVVQKIGNRLVTVLPRPEDLKKLQDSKSLVFSVKGSGDFGQDAHGLKSPRARRVPVPVRPHQRYGRRGRGVGRGRPSSISRIEMKEQGTLTSPTKTVSLLKKDIQEDSILLAETSMDQHLDGCIKLEDTSNEGIVLDMTLPGGSPASAVLVKGPPEDEEFILPDVIVPHIPVTTRRGRRKKRGRGRPRGTYVISSTGRRPGRPRKVRKCI